MMWIWYVIYTLLHNYVQLCVFESLSAHCNALRRTSTHCNTLAAHCNKLRYTATHLSALVAEMKPVFLRWWSCVLQYTAPHCNTLHRNATQCNTLQHTVTHCNILQHTATHCNTPQRTSGRSATGVAALANFSHATPPPACGILCATHSNNATHCNTTQHTATHCHTRRHAATHRN